jgi:hypothetical protein
MPWLVGALLSGLLQIVGSLVGRVLVSLGAAVVTYSGFSASLDYLKSSAVASFAGLPPEVVGMLAVLKVGACISIVTSAMTARLLVTGLQGDTVKKWVTK